MINIMLEGYDMGLDWLRGELSRYVKSGDKVVVIAFSFRDSRVRDAQDWDRLYSRENGMYYGGIAGGFMDYGVWEEDIRFINYFTDSQECKAGSGMQFHRQRTGSYEGLYRGLYRMRYLCEELSGRSN